MADIVGKLAYLYKQATEERSHNYTGAVVREAIIEIATLRAKVSALEGILKRKTLA